MRPRGDVPPALVLLHPDTADVAWGAEVLALEDAVGRRLEGVFVTSAADGSTSPTLTDALRAVRFAGARQVVVAAAGRPELAAARARVAASGLPEVMELSCTFAADAIAIGYAATVAAGGGCWMDDVTTGYEPAEQAG